jgi:Spy/CpxP family protein refolding chaperone
MKRIVLIAPLAIVLSGAVALAQTTSQPDSSPATTTTNPHPGHHFKHNPQREAAFLTKKLNLSSEQESQLEPVLASRDQKISSVMSDAALTHEQKRAQFQTIQQDTKQQLSTILSAEQLQEMQSLHHHHGAGQHQSQSQPSSPSGL